MSGVLGEPSAAEEAVLDVAAAVPSGRVVGYADAAELAGLGRRAARLAGRALARYGSDVPWWRVVRADGGFPQGHEVEALEHYRCEGTPLVWVEGRQPTRVDMSRARWRP